MRDAVRQDDMRKQDPEPSGSAPQPIAEPPGELLGQPVLQDVSALMFVRTGFKARELTGDP